MAKRVLLKMSLCLAASLMITGTANAQTINGDQGVAGLSYKIDQYFKMLGDNIGDNFDLEVQSTDVSDAQEVSEASIVRSVEQNTEAEAVEETKEEVKEESEFANIGISIAESYVRVREKASTDSEVAGKLYHGQIANIVKYQGDWVKIKSGNVEGYIMAEYLAIGEDAEAVIEENVSKIATVATETLKVREKKSVDSACLTLIPEGETYDVIAEYDKWVKISIDDGDIKGKIDNGRNQIDFFSILFCINIPHRVLRSHKFLISINDRICRLFGSATLMDEQETVVRPVFGSNCRQRAHTVWEERNDRFRSIFFTQRSAFIHLTFKLHFCYKAPQPLHKAPFSCTV